MFMSVFSQEDYQKMREASKNSPQLLLKLSPICPTSLQIQRDMEIFLKSGNAPQMWSVDVIKSRALSRDIAEWVGIRHESPQALLVVNGEVVWNASHYSVRKGTIVEVLEKIQTGPL